MSGADRGTGQPMQPQVFTAERPHAPGVAEFPAPRVIATGETGRIVPQPLVTPATSAEPARRRPSLFKKLTWVGLLAAFSGWLAVDLYLWVVSAFNYGPALGWVATAALAIGVVAASTIAAREIRSYLALKEVEVNQKRLAAAVEGKIRPSEAQEAIREVIGEIPKDAESIAAIEAFQRQVQPHHTPQQQIEILSQTVMAPLDRRAESIVRRASSRAFGITAISPTAVTDAIFFITTSVRMVRRIAACYGHRPTALATVHLLRRLVLEAGKLGAVDLAGAALTQHIGGAVAERVAASAAESMYASQRMARLGLVTMSLCRPVPFRLNETPGIMSSLIGNLFSRRAE